MKGAYVTMVDNGYLVVQQWSTAVLPQFVPEGRFHLYLESCEPPSQKVSSFAKESKALPLRTPVALMRLFLLNRRFFLVEASLPTRSG